MITAVVLVAVLQASTAQTTPDLSWLSGYWLSCDGGREVSETWSDDRAGVLANTTLTIAASRASVETATITRDETGMTFHARPDGQAPADFALSDSGPMRVVFSNPGHDFPQRVIYSRTGELLSARIEGRISGRDRVIDWSYRKAELNARCLH